MMAGMDLPAMLREAAAHGASDLHLQPDAPPTVRLLGELRTDGPPCAAATLERLARELVGPADWPAALARRSADLARVVAGVRCRINVLWSHAGPGLAIRLLPEGVPTLRDLNLHPALGRLVAARDGLVLVAGATGSGKTSTLAALLHELDRNEARHVVTIEQPVEFVLRPTRCLVRQREVGRDTPDDAQALLDALREDIDVLMVGELRRPEVMRLTLDACETGHLVLASIHASSTVEALQRLVSAFPAEQQPSVCSRLATSLVGVVAQQLRHREDLGFRVPVCEVLAGSTAARSVIRQGQLHKLPTVLQTGAADGAWTLPRYEAWLEDRADLRAPALQRDVGRPLDLASACARPTRALDDAARAAEPAPAARTSPPDDAASRPGDADADPDVIVLQPEESELSDLLADLEEDEGGAR